MKPYYQDKRSGITIFHGDVRDVLPRLEDASVDVVWTDPPYGHNNNDGDLAHNIETARGIASRGDHDARPIANDGPAEMREVVESMLTQTARVLKKTGACLVCCSGGGGVGCEFAWLAQRMDQGGLAFFHGVVWDKGALGLGWRYRRNYEMIMVAHRRGGRIKWEWKGCGPETSNVVRIGKIIPSKDDHPTPKPPALVRHFLRLHAKAGDLVLDPFMGHGVVLRVAKDMRMRAIGVELEEKYCEVAAKQLSQGVLGPRQPAAQPRPRRVHADLGLGSACVACGAPVVWVPNARSGSKIPLDRAPSADGGVTIVGGQAVAVKKGEPGQRWSRHSRTCKGAK